MMLGLTTMAANAPPPRRLLREAAALSVLVALAAASMPGQLTAQTADSAGLRPNIVLFLADDMGWGQVGFNGGTDVATPNMDRIANEGVKLTQFYVQPVCTASRGALLTGRYPWKNGTQHRVGLRDSQGMLTDERTIAQTLRDAGYATWIVGKWHLGQWSRAHLPLQRGFDHHYGHYSGEINSFTLHRGRNHRGILDWHRNGRPVVESGYSTFLMADEAVALIERHDGRSPFFLYLPFNAVHVRHQAPDEYIEPYKDLDHPEQLGQLKALDVAIGQVIDALDAKGVLGDTLVMFLNDNGGTVTAGENAPYRGKKSGFFEGGVRVPAAIRWPDQVTAASVSDAMLHAVDLFPTFSGLAGADTSTGLALDGVDAWDAIADGADSPRTEVVFALDVIRVGDFKLIEEDADHYDPAPGEVLLYNIADDPYEETNLASSETEKIEELRARLTYHKSFARDGETVEEIPDHPPRVYGEEEDTTYGAAAKRAVTERNRGNSGPALLRIEASGAILRLIYDKTLDSDFVPPATAFTVVENPGYVSAEVTGVEVVETEVVLTLERAAATGGTVGLTYEVPASGAILDTDDLEAVGVIWVTAEVTEPPNVTVSPTTLTVMEGAAAASMYTVVLTAQPSADVTVTVTVPAGTDARVDKASLTFTVDDWNVAQTVAVTAVDDADAVVDGTVTIGHTASGGGYDSVTIDSVQVAITESDSAAVTVSVDALTVREGSSETYTVVLTSEPTGPVTVTSSVPANSDVSADPLSLTFAQGTWDVAQTVTVAAARDADLLADAPVTVSHTATGADYAGVSVPEVRVTIVEIDTPTLSVGAERASENELEMVFEVALSASGSSEATVDYATSDGSGSVGARAGSDYTAASGTLTFPASSTSTQQIVVTITDDTADEEEEETFRLTLSNVQNASLAGGGSTLQATGTIEDDDDPEVEVSFGLADYEVTEGDTVNVVVRLSRDPERDLTIDLDRTHHGGVTDADYTGVPSSVTFGPGVTSRGFQFAATEDTVNDDGEAVELSFGSLPNRVSGSGETTLAIQDNDDSDGTDRDGGDGGSTGSGGGGGGGGGSPPPPDPDPPPPTPSLPPTVSVEAAGASESAGAVTFNVRLSASSGAAVTVDYATADGAGASGARAGSDYTATQGTLTFPAGSSTRQIRVLVTDDAADEGEAETFTLTLRNPRDASLAGGGSVLRVIGTIRDDDSGPPMAAFAVTGASCAADLCRTVTGEAVEFVDTSAGTVRSRRWEFGDGTASRSRRPEHSWSSPGFYEVTLRASDGTTESTASRTFLVEASDPAGSCVVDEETLCLQDSRYAVTVAWWTGAGESGAGSVVHAGTNDSGLFTFFSRENWEVLIKVLDGCAVNGHVWVYGASTTDLGYSIRVTDTVTGTVKEYRNEPGLPAPAITDATAFPVGCQP